jgi:LacI family transcriptional regulator
MTQRLAITIRDLAHLAGVHHSTVSRALSRSSRISPAVQQRIARLASKHGYHLNPMVSAFMSHRRQTRAITVNTTLAFLSNHPIGLSWRRFDSLVQNYTGAAKQAARRGYRLEEFSLAQPGLTPRRLAQILRTRNIQGIIVGSLARPLTALEFDWQQFCAVAIGFSLIEPPLLHVGNDHYHSMQMALRECHQRGSLRPGLVLTHSIDQRSHGRWLAAYLYQQRLSKGSERCSPFIGSNGPFFEFDKFSHWLAREKPDSLIGIPLLPTEGWREMLSGFPRKIGWITLDLTNPGGWDSGIFQNHERIGATALDQLVMLVERNQPGPLTEAQNLLIQGTWMDGKSMPSAE